ncbi:MAG: metalloregulator ArsR/SmtB family transcription factor [Candidatus Hinthialibacter antarcticus]|nr:metalloregulator ArsR/SmtB family transcription factor [Candidatus Hinthialibacter antarcticus]
MNLKLLMPILKALADENRVRILLALRGGELCACQIIELLGLAPSTVSKHLSILKNAGLVDSRKDGRWMYFELASDENAPAAGAIQYIASNIERDEQVKFDQKRLKAILNIEPETLCRRQSESRESGEACCSSDRPTLQSRN